MTRVFTFGNVCLFDLTAVFIGKHFLGHKFVELLHVAVHMQYSGQFLFHKRSHERQNLVHERYNVNEVKTDQPDGSSFLKYSDLGYLS